MLVRRSLLRKSRRRGFELIHMSLFLMIFLSSILILGRFLKDRRLELISPGNRVDDLYEIQEALEREHQAYAERNSEFQHCWKLPKHRICLDFRSPDLGHGGPSSGSH